MVEILYHIIMVFAITINPSDFIVTFFYKNCGARSQLKWDIKSSAKFKMEAQVYKNLVVKHLCNKLECLYFQSNFTLV